MPLSKSAAPKGKKQTAMPGPRSAAYKKIVAASRKRAGRKSGASKPTKKRTAAFTSVESRQRALERVKCAIWSNLDAINSAIIHLAMSGNYMAAKALFDVAGVYSLPPLEDEPKAQPLPQTAPAAEAVAANAPPPAIDAFFQSIGIEPVRESSHPGMAASAL